MHISIISIISRILNFTLKGQLLTKGAKIEDYSIQIGVGICAVTELLDNLITCKPPRHEPSVNKTGAYKTGQPRIFVRNTFISNTFNEKLLF